MLIILLLYIYFTIYGIHSNCNVALITEVEPVAIVPNFVLQRKLLTPFREQTGETVLVSLSICLSVCTFVCI